MRPEDTSTEDVSTQDVAAMREEYSAALDEVFHLRALLAHQAAETRRHTALVSFPKSRRAAAAAQVDLAERAARGQAGQVYRELVNPKNYLRAVGAATTLTRAVWEADRGQATRLAPDPT